MNRDLEELTRKQYDVVVLGGGIYGACIAWDATLRGLSVALIEQKDFGHATSANSHKVVHGGLRYLQHADLKRMRESIRERTNLMRIAPHLVHPLPCIMPTYGHLMKGREMMAMALFLNDLISFDRNKLDDPQKQIPAGKVVSRDECLELLPGIDASGLTGGAVWYDAQMYNSERLTLAFVRSAAERGARVANYVKATGLVWEEGQVAGVHAVDQLSGNALEIQGRLVVNATGPWIDALLRSFGIEREDVQLGIRLAKGISIATREIFAHTAAGLSSRNGDPGVPEENRLFFITPWHGRSIIGTTYTLYEQHPDNMTVTIDDVREVLEQVNAIYPPAKLTLDDVSYAYCGLLPASNVNEETGSVKRAGHYQIRDHAEAGLPGLLSVLGVKYTTARDVAEKVVTRVFHMIGRSPVPTCSDKTPLHGGDINGFEKFMTGEMKRNRPGLPPQHLQSLLYNYGSAYPQLLDYLDSRATASGERTDYGALLRAQTRYAVNEEMAQRLGDVVFRRTELHVDDTLDESCLALCARTMAQEAGWSAEREQAEIDDVKATIEAMPGLTL